MHTSLYKLMMKYARAAGYMCMNINDPGIYKNNIQAQTRGRVAFSYKAGGIYVEYPSHEYDAWHLFMLCQRPLHIAAFIAKNWKRLSAYFPQTAIWLDMNMKTSAQVFRVLKKVLHDMDEYYVSNEDAMMAYLAKHGYAGLLDVLKQDLEQCHAKHIT